MIETCLHCKRTIPNLSSSPVDVVESTGTLHFCGYACLELWLVVVRLSIENKRDSGGY